MDPRQPLNQVINYWVDKLTDNGLIIIGYKRKIFSYYLIWVLHFEIYKGKTFYAFWFLFKFN